MSSCSLQAVTRICVLQDLFHRTLQVGLCAHAYTDFITPSMRDAQHASILSIAVKTHKFIAIPQVPLHFQLD